MGFIFSTKVFSRFNNQISLGWNSIGYGFYLIEENEFYVLEDNVRTPSGVSYMLENRETMLK